ncbi:MAG: ribonuclease III [Coriobacteriia bacterium]|nr:ribonuclease III [Coriobacteriia bacterium]
MFSVEELERIDRAQRIIGYTFKNQQLILSAITHPSAAEGKPVQYSYERLEFLGDSVLGVIVAMAAFEKFKDLDEGGLTRIKVALVAGSTLSSVADELGFTDIIIFGDSEVGTGKRGMHSALENVYEAVVAALYIDGGFNVARDFIARTLLPRMTRDYAAKPENPKSMLQEKLQTEGITPTYKLVETQGPPHDRTFVSAVFAGMQSLARGVGRTKKESESRAAAQALKELEQQRKAEATAEAKAAKKAEKDRKRAEKEARRAKASELPAEIPVGVSMDEPPADIPIATPVESPSKDGVE